MPMRAQAFAGTPVTGALWQPFIAPADLLAGFGGIPLGPELRTGRLMVFDPWMLQRQRIIHSTVIGIYGEKDGGKTTLMRTLARRLMVLQAGMRLGDPVEIRARIHSRKPEGDAEGKEESEYAALSNCLHSKVFSPASFGSVNIFDPTMSMSYSDIVETAVNFAELNADRTLVRFEPLALQIGVWKMLTAMPKLATRELLAEIVRRLDADDVNAYFNASNEEMLQSLSNALFDDPELAVQLKSVMSKPDNINADDFSRDAGQVSAFLGQVVPGASSDLFRGTGSLSEMLSGAVVTIDWDGIEGKSKMALESMLFKWQTLRPEYRPHVNLQDEAGMALNSLMLARAQYNYVKKARAYETADISGTQYRSDVTHKGAPGSELRSLAEGIMLGTGLYMFTRQPEDDAVLNDLAQLGISNRDLDFMTHLEVGCFGIKVPQQPISFFGLQLTPSDLLFNSGNAASERMTKRQNVWDNQAFIERAQRLGVTKIGEQ